MSAACLQCGGPTQPFPSVVHGSQYDVCLACDGIQQGGRVLFLSRRASGQTAAMREAGAQAAPQEGCAR